MLRARLHFSWHSHLFPFGICHLSFVSLRLTRYPLFRNRWHLTKIKYIGLVINTVNFCFSFVFGSKTHMTVENNVIAFASVLFDKFHVHDQLLVNSVLFLVTFCVYIYILDIIFFSVFCFFVVLLTSKQFFDLFQWYATISV